MVNITRNAALKLYRIQSLQEGWLDACSNDGWVTSAAVTADNTSDTYYLTLDVYQRP